MTDATEYVVVLTECNPDYTSEGIASEVAFVFLSPSRLFKLWLDALTYKYLPTLYRTLP